MLKMSKWFKTAIKKKEEKSIIEMKIRFLCNKMYCKDFKTKMCLQKYAYL